MGQAIPVRTDYTVGEVRQFAKRAKDAAQARRLLAIAAVLDGTSREDAAKIGGIARHRMGGWGVPVKAQGSGGLINSPLTCRPPQLPGSYKGLLPLGVMAG